MQYDPAAAGGVHPVGLMVGAVAIPSRLHRAVAKWVWDHPGVIRPGSSLGLEVLKNVISPKEFDVIAATLLSSGAAGGEAGVALPTLHAFVMGQL